MPKSNKPATYSNTLYSTATSRADKSVTEGFLADCEKLKPEVYCESLYLTEILPLVKKKEKRCTFQPVTLPMNELSKLCRLGKNPKKLLNRFSTLSLANTPAVQDAQIPFAILEKEVNRANLWKNIVNKKIKTEKSTTKTGRNIRSKNKQPINIDSKEQEKIITQASRQLKQLQKMYSINTNPASTLATPLSAQKNIIDYIRDLISDLPLPQSAAIQPAIGFEVNYKQDWCSKGYRRGRLVRSISLPADGRKEISIKSWDIRKQRREENESVESDISTEIVGDEKWTLATTKKLSTELNQSMDSNLKVSGDVPIKGVSVGAEAGGGSETSGALSSSITNTEERIQQATIKVTDSLKKKVSSSIEISEETGLETTITETVINPNKCHSLTYHFFEVTERYHVTTRVQSLSPVLLLALPSPSITPEWLLCHECLLKKYLPCESYYAGFDAAKTVLSHGMLGHFLGTLDSEEIQQATDTTLATLESVLAAYLTLRNATINLGSGPGELSGRIGNVLQDLANGAGELAEKGAELFEDSVELVETVLEDMGELAIEAGQSMLDGIESIFTFASQARTANGATMAFSVAHTPGGIGSYIYWQVSEITAPELGTALAGLEAAHDRIAAMPAGAARTNALISALRTFFSSLGDIDEVFRKISTGVKVVETFMTAAAIVPLLGTAALPLALLGSPALAALEEFAQVLIGLDIDIAADDEGLKDAIAGLYGLLQQLGQASDLPVAPNSDEPADNTAYQQELQAAKRQRQELAEAQVELDRLLCHIRENRVHYAQIYWSSLPSADIERIIQEDFNIPSHFVEPRITGFDGIYAAFRVTNHKWLRLSGIDIENAMQELAVSGLLDNTRQTTEIEMPTRGLTIEPELGRCNACDDIMQFHREQDKLLKQEDVEQAKLETRRLQERINLGLLDDPTPFENAASVVVRTNMDAVSELPAVTDDE